MEEKDELSELCGLSGTWSPETLASMLKTIWQNLEVKNLDDFAKRKEDKIPFMILSREVIDIIFCIGRRLNQTTEAQFITIEILDRFIISEIMAVWNWSRNKDSSEWERTLSLVKKQFMLRLLCCMGLASKIDGSPGRILKPKVLARYLSKNDRTITIRAVCLSEFHILRLIDYKPPLTSSLTYVNALCCLLCSQRPVPAALATRCVASQLREMSNRILCLATANHHRVYDSLAEFARRNSGSVVSDEDLVAARCDRILLSAGAVTLAAVFASAADADSLLLRGEVAPGSAALDTVLQVSALTGIAHQDVEAVAAVLAHTTGLLDALQRRETQQPVTIKSEEEVAAQPSTLMELPEGTQGIDINHWLAEVRTFTTAERQENVADGGNSHRHHKSPHLYGHVKNRAHHETFVSPKHNPADSRATARIDSGIGTSRRTGRNPPYQRPAVEGSRQRVDIRADKEKGRLRSAAGAPSRSYLCRDTSKI